MQPPPQYLEALAPVTACMLAEARMAPGQHVLDVGSGSGDMSIAAAEIVGPSGRVLATDISSQRMAGLADRCRQLFEPGRVEILECAAEDLALAGSRFDVALARNSVMYFTDLRRALRNIHASLKPGGRFVAAIYGTLDREPFHAIPVAAVLRRRPLTAPLPDYAQAFKLDADELQAALSDSGFRDVRSQFVATTRTYPSVDALLAQLRASPSCRELLACLRADEIEDAWVDVEQGFRQFASADGITIRGQQIVVVGIT